VFPGASPAFERRQGAKTEGTKPSLAPTAQLLLKEFKLAESKGFGIVRHDGLSGMLTRLPQTAQENRTASCGPRAVGLGDPWEACELAKAVGWFGFALLRYLYNLHVARDQRRDFSKSNQWPNNWPTNCLRRGVSILTQSKKMACRLLNHDQMGRRAFPSEKELP
jgi:hypothetical protein